MQNQPTHSPLIKEVLLDAPVDRVWKAITDRDEMKEWSFDINKFKPEVGFEFEFYGEKDGHKFLHRCKILEVEPLRKLVHTWTYEEHPDAETIVAWELFPEGEKTRLRLTHTGLENLPQDENFARENFIGGWNHILGVSLIKYLGGR